MSSTTVLSTI